MGRAARVVQLLFGWCTTIVVQNCLETHRRNMYKKAPFFISIKVLLLTSIFSNVSNLQPLHPHYDSGKIFLQEPNMCTIPLLTDSHWQVIIRGYLLAHTTGTSVQGGGDMQVPVISDGKAFLQDLSEVTFITRGMNNRDIVCSTLTDSPRLVRSIQEVAAAFTGTSFFRVNQDIVVNLDRAKSYDYELNILHFIPSGVEKLDRVQVSRENRTRVKRYLQEHGIG